MVQLVLMTNDEYEAYLERAVKDYAHDKVTAGAWKPSEALEKSEAAYLELLPDGVATKDHHLFTVKDIQTDAKVGMIWFAKLEALSKPVAFIYDFLIYEAQRRKGYGGQTLKSLEAKVKELGITTLSLHVFGHNKGALDLYQKLGFEMTSIQMSKQLTL